MMRREKKTPGKFTGNDYARSQDRADMVIVGNGIAGLTAAIEARRLAPEKSIAIVTEQSHPTINAPGLKQFAFGKLAREQLLVYPAGTERAQHIDVINARVEEISSRGKFISLNDGSIFSYDSLLLAIGSKPNGLPAGVPGRTFDGVLNLHRLVDYLDLHRRLRLREVRDAVVVGGGTHAMETVMGLLRGGIHVYWLLRSATFLPATLDSTASEIVLEQSRRAGARVETETEVEGIVGRVGSVAGVVTNRQQMIPCQLVLVCTGIAPVTTLAESCDIPIERQRGIIVDDHLRTNVDDIYAAGDAAALWNPRTKKHELRAQWHAAAAQGRIAAAFMAGHPESASSFGVPWHMTRLGKLSLLTVGDPLHELEGATTLIDRKKAGYRVVSMRDDRLVGYLSLGLTQPDGLAIKRMVDEELPIRDVASALLTGEFDARQYFSQHHAQTAHRMAVTGELPVLETPRPTFQAIPETETERSTEPLLLTSLTGKQVDTDPLQKRVEELAHLCGSVTFQADMNGEAGRWIVPTLLPEGLVVLAGKQQTGKSWPGMEIGLAVAGGETVLGNLRAAQGKVLYLALEESERGIQERLSRWPVQGETFQRDFEYAMNWPRMDDDGLADIESWLVTRPQARLVIIDAWNAVQPAREQSAADGTTHDAELEVFERSRKLAHTYRVCILVHFHIDHAISDHLFEELAASSSLNACADGILHLKRLRENEGAALSGVGRAYEQPLDLVLSFDDGRWKITEHTVIPARAPLSKERVDILDVLDELHRPMKSKEIALVLGKRDVTIRRMLYKMKASGLIEETEQGYRALVPREERTRQAGNRRVAEYGRERDNDGNDVEQVHPQNITLFQRPLPGAKRRTSALHSHVVPAEAMPGIAVSDTQPLMLEQG